MKLCEIAKPKPIPTKQLLNHQDIKNWLDEQGVKNYDIRPNGIVDVDRAAVDLRKFKGTTLPVQFGKVDGSFWCNMAPLTSLQGSPQEVGHDFWCNNTKITSLVGVPQYIGGRFACFQTRKISLSGIDKMIKYIGGEVSCGKEATHILGLLLIEGITHFDIDSGGPIDTIFNTYLGTGDILSAQDELIDAGLIDQARL